jgi:hypothetical protein
MKPSRWALLVGLHLLVPGCAYQAPSEEEVRRLELDPEGEIGVQVSAIENGTLETTQRGVVELFTPTQFCTGALVSNDNVITAAHCVDDIMGTLSDEDLDIEVWYFDPDTGTKRKISRRLMRAAIIPGYNCFHSSCADGQADLAILSHDEPWIGAEAGHPNPSTQLTTGDYLRISAGSLDNVTDLRLYGRGFSQAVPADGDGKLRSMPLIVHRKYDYYFYSLSSYMATCEGDSGGPYIGTVNGRRVIVGVHSYRSGSAVTCADDGDRQYATRTSSREHWIKLKLGEHNCEDGPEYYRCF